ncbi:MAG: LutC/YkgG family protein [Aureispira sp.]
MDSARDRILNKLKKRVDRSEPLPYSNAPTGSLFFEAEDALEVVFAKQFSANGGRFVYCNSVQELEEQLHSLSEHRQWNAIHCKEDAVHDLLGDTPLPLQKEIAAPLQVPASLTTCEALIARTGTILLSSNTAAGRSLSIVPPVHLVLATPNQIVYHLKEILSLQTARETEWPSMLCFASTNSRTADIEKTLVNGAHGPKELFVFLLDT